MKEITKRQKDNIFLLIGLVGVCLLFGLLVVTWSDKVILERQLEVREELLLNIEYCNELTTSLWLKVRDGYDDWTNDEYWNEYASYGCDVYLPFQYVDLRLMQAELQSKGVLP